MKLTQEQRALMADFFSTHLPGFEAAYMGHAPPRRITFFGVPLVAAGMHAMALSHNLFDVNPSPSPASFFKTMKTRIPELHKLSRKVHDLFSTLPERPSVSPEKFVQSFFLLSGRLKIPFSKQVESFRMTAAFVPQWMQIEPVAIGKPAKFFLRPTLVSHEDAPLSLEVVTPQGFRVATVGGYLYHGKEGPSLRLFYPQGVPLDAREDIMARRRPQKAQEETYKELTRLLGKNWRVHLLEEMVKHAGADLPVVAERPIRWFDHRDAPFVSEGDFKRQHKQAAGAFKKAGLKKQEDGTFHKKPPKRRRQAK